MAAHRVVIQEQRAYSFAASDTVELVRYVDTLAWVSGVLEVTVYDASLTGANTLDVEIDNISPAPDDPRRAFVAGQVATVRLNPSTTAPKLLTDAFTTPIASHVRVRLVFTHAEGGAQTATLGIALIGRER